MEPTRAQASFRQWWSQARPTKTLVFWACAASVVLTMTVGFTWGGWVTGSTARAMALTSGEQAVVKRLAPICVVRFNEEPEKARKLQELTEISEWQRSGYVQKQGWATMPGEQEPDADVAMECARLLGANSR